MDNGVAPVTPSALTTDHYESPLKPPLREGEREREKGGEERERELVEILYHPVFLLYKQTASLFPLSSSFLSTRRWYDDDISFPGDNREEINYRRWIFASDSSRRDVNRVLR